MPSVFSPGSAGRGVPQSVSNFGRAPLLTACRAGNLSGKTPTLSAPQELHSGSNTLILAPDLAHALVKNSMSAAGRPYHARTIVPGPAEIASATAVERASALRK